MRKEKGIGGGRSNGLLPNSLRIISSCLKSVSNNASTVASTVRSAGASVAASISVSGEDEKDQVLWAGFDKLELGPSASKNVLLLGYINGFQVLDVEDASNVRELVSKHDGPVTFLQMQPIPKKSEDHEGFRASRPLLLVVAGDESSTGLVQGGSHSGGLVRDNNVEPQPGNSLSSPTAVRFYSLRSHAYVHVLRFRSPIYMVRCSPQIVAVGLAAQIYCFDALTLENKFSILTYPVPQVGGQGVFGVNIGYGPMAVGPRWLAYASNNLLLSNMGSLSPQNLTPSPGVSPSTSPGSGSLMARYAMESSKQLAAGLINLGDMGYKTLSKYCQDLLPDGSNSPASSNSSWKGRLGSSTHSIEADNAGMVVIKDFVSRAVISQFRAHTSPISALCFDPSGTLLVTASVHGNNLNVFRIMPSCIRNGSGTPNYDWSSSHVHLYKLYRGITTAVIQDICFSHYSQWIAIVSSKGTCHIFVLSPFGGDGGLQTQPSHCDGPPTLLPGLSLPWWSTSSFIVNHQSSPPPPPVTLSVVSRIKNGNSGWLNTVGNVATSATGKVSVPSGAVAAAFHNSGTRGPHSVLSKTNALEHLLVYTPSGHLIQHELLPSLGVEPSGSTGSRTASGSLVQVQDEELKVKIEPVQWWSVCRRSDWPEREESISGITLDRQESAEIVIDNSDSEDNSTKYSMELNNSIGGTYFVKPHERPHWYLSNAEVQISSERIPIWQKSKISFHVMIPPRPNEKKFTKDNIGGEIEIEKVTVHDIEIKRKDLLPVFDHFHSIKSAWTDRDLVAGIYPSTSYEPSRSKEKFKEESSSCQSKPASFGSMASSDSGSSRTTESLLDLYHMTSDKSYAHMNQTMDAIDCGNRGSFIHSPPLVSQTSSNRDCVSSPFEHSTRGDSEDDASSGLSSLKSDSACGGTSIAKGLPSSSISGISEVFNASSDHSISSLNNLMEEPVHVDSHDSIDFEQYFQEGYCEVLELDEYSKSTEVVNDADISSSQCEQEKPEEDGENDDMFGGIFSFSEEG